MSTLVEDLSAQAKTLPAEDRARLAEELLQSLQGDGDSETETETDAAWDREIERRVAEIEAGTVEFILADEVHAQARRLIRR